MVYGNRFLTEGALETLKIGKIKLYIKEGEIEWACQDLKFLMGKVPSNKCKELINDIKPKATKKQYDSLMDVYYNVYPEEKAKDFPDTSIKIEDKNKFIKSILIPKIKQYIAEVNKDEKLKKEATKRMNKIEDKEERSPIRLKYDDSDINHGYFCLVDGGQEANIAMRYMIDAVADKLRKDEEIRKYKISFHCGDGDEGCLYFKIN